MAKKVKFVKFVLKSLFILLNVGTFVFSSVFYIDFKK